METKQVVLFFFALLLAGCTVKRELVKPQTGSTTPGPIIPGTIPELKVRTVTGEWIAADGGSGGVNNFDTHKNYLYTIEVKNNNQKLDITLTSADIDVQFALFNPLGQRMDISSTSRSSVKTYTVNAGTYRIAVCAARRAVGKFILTVVGVNSDPARIPSRILQSDKQDWGTLGGGGKNVTYKNKFYTFEVTEDNFGVDLELESAETDVALYLYDALGESLYSGNIGNDRYRFRILSLNKGTYTIMAATGVRGGVGSYQLRVFGKIQNLKRVESQATTVTGTWANNKSFDTYSLQLTATTSPLDIDLSSASAEVLIELQDSVGKRIQTSGASSKSEVLLGQNLPKGTYLIKVYPYKGFGNYTLSVHGQFTGFKKI